MGEATPAQRICKRCGKVLKGKEFGRTCKPCRNGHGRMYEDFGTGTARSPEIPSAVESNRHRH